MRTDGNRGAAMFSELVRFGRNKQVQVSKFLRRECADSADGLPLCCGDVPWFCP